MNGGGGGQRVVRFRVYFAGPAHSAGRCAWPLRFPLAGRRHVNFISIATHLGAVSFLPPHLEACSHFQPGHGAMSSVTWRQKGRDSDQKRYPAARPPAQGESGSVPSTSKKFDPFCRGESEGSRSQVILGAWAGPGTPAAPSGMVGTQTVPSITWL